MSKKRKITYFDRANPYPPLTTPTQAKADKIPKDEDSVKVEGQESAEMGSKELQGSPTKEQSSMGLVPVTSLKKHTGVAGINNNRE